MTWTHLSLQAVHEISVLVTYDSKEDSDVSEQMQRLLRTFSASTNKIGT